MSLVTIVHILYHGVIILSMERFSGVFFEKRITPTPVMLASYVGCFVLYTMACFFWQNQFVYLMAVLLTFFIVTLNYESSMVKRFVVVVSGYMGSTAIASVVLIMTQPEASHGFNLFGIDTELQGSVFVYIFVGLATYSITLLLRKFRNIKKSTVFPSMFLVATAAIQLALLITSLFSLSYLPQRIALVAVIGVFGSCVGFLYIYDRLSAVYEDNLSAALYTQEREYYFTQCQLMQEAMERVRALRHDMRLHLTTIKGFSSKIKADEITNYLNKLLEDISESKVYSSTGNIPIDSIINFKLNKSQNKNIKPEIRMLIPPVINVELTDIAIILGNLLDNALEAAEKTEEKTVKLEIELNKGTLLIQIDNSFDGVVKYGSEKDSGSRRIITRKNNSASGYGLNNVKRSVEKYNGYMDISHDEKIFSAKVFLYVNDYATHQLPG